MGRPRPSWAVQGRPGPSWAVQGGPGSFRVVQGRPGPFGAVLDRLGPFRAVQSCQGSGSFRADQGRHDTRSVTAPRHDTGRHFKCNGGSPARWPVKCPGCILKAALSEREMREVADVTWCRGRSFPESRTCQLVKRDCF